jgi:hypothetical protein
MSELCDCGHSDYEHEDDDGACQISGCDCDGFTGHERDDDEEEED